MLFFVIFSALFIASESSLLNCPYPPVSDCTSGSADVRNVCQFDESTATCQELGTLCDTCTNNGNQVPSRTGLCCDPTATDPCDQANTALKCDSFGAIGVCRCKNCGNDKQCQSPYVCNLDSSSTTQCGSCGVPPTAEPITAGPTTPYPTPTDPCGAMPRSCDSTQNYPCTAYGYPPDTAKCDPIANSADGCYECVCTECITGVANACSGDLVCSSPNNYYCGKCEAAPTTSPPTTADPPTPYPTPTDPCANVERSCDSTQNQPCKDFAYPPTFATCGTIAHSQCPQCSCTDCRTGTEYNDCADGSICFSSNNYYCGVCQAVPTTADPTPSGPTTPPPATPYPTPADPCGTVERSCDSTQSNPCYTYGYPPTTAECETVVNGPCSQCKCTDCRTGFDNECGVGFICFSYDGRYCGVCQAAPVPTPGPTEPTASPTDLCSTLSRSCDLNGPPACDPDLECKTQSVFINNVQRQCPVCSCRECDINSAQNMNQNDCASATQTCDGSSVTEFTFAADNVYLKCGTCVDPPSASATAEPTPKSPTATQTDPCSNLARSCDLNDPACDAGLECKTQSVFVTNTATKECSVCSCPECDVNNQQTGCEFTTQTCDDSGATEFYFAGDHMSLKCGKCKSPTAYPVQGPVALPSVTCETNECTEDASVTTCTDGKCDVVDGCRVCVVSPPTTADPTTPEPTTPEPTTSEPTTAPPTAEDEDQTCTSDAVEGVCLDSVESNNRLCQKTVSAAARQSSKVAGTVVAALTCEICAKKTNLGDPLCECLSMLQSDLGNGLKTRISEWVQNKLLKYCFADCESMDDVMITGDTCACESLKCKEEVGSVQTTTTSTENPDEDVFTSDAYNYCIYAAIWIGFVFYLIQ